MRVYLALLFLVLGMTSGGFLWGQSPNASISGVVLDPEKKSIADAGILVVNDYTRVQYEAKTNAEGFFVVTGLPPGQYRIQVSKVGFKAIIKPDIVLNVQDALAITFTLPIGASSVVVTVQSAAPVMNTVDGSVSTVVDRQFAENLPLNGRSFQSLIYLTPGVVAVAANTSDNGQFSVNGQRAASNYWMVDGVSANIGVGAANQGGGNGLGGAVGSFSALGGTNSLVSVDAMQEFRIQTSTFAPEFGRTPGGQISIVTRSGVNAIHGTLFDYFRNDALDANNWFNTSVVPSLSKAEERQNDFGGTFSGPLIKDKTFFFFSYEGLRLRLPQTALTNVPDLTARASAVAAMQPYLNAYPIPNGAEIGTGMAQFDASYSNPASLNAYSLRIDHKLGKAWNVFGRYNYSPSNYEQRGGSQASALSVVNESSITTQTGTVGAVWVVTPALTNDARFNYSRVEANVSGRLDNFGGAVPLASLPLPNPYTGSDSQFAFYIFGLGTGSGLQTGHAGENVQRQINFVDSVAFQKGTHGIKFGADFRRLSPKSNPNRYFQEAAFHSVANAELGMSYFSQVIADNNARFIFKNVGVYAQDTWRVHPHLTITYGLRWDVDPAPSSGNGLNLPAITGYDPTDLSHLAVASAGTSPFNTTYGNVAPRLGLAYQIRQTEGRQTVLRGGFGVFYDLVSSEAGNVYNGFSSVPPFAASVVYRNVNFPLLPEQIVPPSIPPTANVAQITAFDPNLKLPYTLEWNVAVEQSLGTAQTVSVTYLGASGNRLLQSLTYLSPATNPSIQYAIVTGNEGNSNYNALQVQFQRRLQSGFQALASYTFSHSIDSGSAGSPLVSSNLSSPSGSGSNRGDSDFDVRHAFTAGLTYSIPSPRQQRRVEFLFRNWSVQAFLTARSAVPVDITDTNVFLLESGLLINIRPDVVPGQPLDLHGSRYPGGKALNPAAFTDPPIAPVSGNPQRQGTLGRNALRAFSATQCDFAVHRDFPVRERVKIQFRAEMFNVLNHPNFGPPMNAFGQTGFGLATQTLNQSLNGGALGSAVGAGAFDPLYQLGGPRSIQLALKIVF